jgi:hypothetical protein
MQINISDFRGRTQRKGHALASAQKEKELDSEKLVLSLEQAQAKGQTDILTLRFFTFSSFLTIEYNEREDEAAEDHAAESDSFFRRQTGRNAD